MGTRRAIAAIVAVLAAASIALATGRLQLFETSEAASDPPFVVVPMDGVSGDTAAKVARKLSRAYNIPVQVAPRMRSEDVAINRDRRQLDGGALVAQLARRFQTAERASPVIGVTNADIYWSDRPHWQFVFGVLGLDGEGAISTARMDPRNYGIAPDDRALERRLTVMMARYLTRLAFDLDADATDRRSVLRDSVLEVADLDEMTPWVCPERPGDRRPC